MRTTILHTRFILLLAAAGPTAVVQAQLSVNNTVTVQYLVENVLLGGGVTVSNITFNGMPAGFSNIQIGSFNGSACNVGLAQGLMLCTGDIALALGPNNTDSQTLPAAGTGAFGDPDLDQTSNSTTYDGAVLEFDLVPTGDEISFNYVFASEEYLEYVNAGYNDVFGFFLSGPGLNGPYANNAVNIALVPGSSSVVSIDNVNNMSNPAYYVDNGDGFSFPWDSDPQYIQFDGFTVPLTAYATVQCGQTYHLKIAIADAGDPYLDSGVFLEGGSFSSPTPLSVEAQTDSPFGELVEGCAGATIVLTRSDTQNAMDVTVSVSGTTTNGTDHTTVPAVFSFPAGQATINFDLEAFEDFITEGTEQLTLTFAYPDLCGQTSTIVLTIPVVDNTMAVVVNTTATVCPGACSGSASAVMSGGSAPFSYAWSNSLAGTGATSAASICAGSYSIIVEDDLGCTAEDTFDVVDGTALTVDAGTDIASCGDPVLLQAEVVGATTGLVWAWTPATGLSNPGISGPVATVSATTDYAVTVYPTGFPDCAVTDNVTITFDPGPDPGTDSAIVICPTQPSFALIDMLGGIPETGGSWVNAIGDPVPGTFDPATGVEGVFFYSVTSAEGCTNTASVTIDVLDITDPVCCGTVDAGPNATTCGLSHVLQAATGNIGSGTWTGPPGYVIAQAQSAQTTVTASVAGTATFTWTEDDGTCHVVDDVTVTFTDTLVVVVSSTGALCNGVCDGTATAVPQGGTAPFNYQWSNAAGPLSNAADAEDLCAGSLSLILSDANGCTAQADLIITEPAPVPIPELSFMEPWCYGSCDGTVTITAPNAVAYSFDGGATFGPASVFPNACVGDYPIVIRNANGCLASASITVTGPPPVVANFIYGPDPATVEATSISFINTSVNDVSLLWDIAGLATSDQDQCSYTFDFRQPAEYEVCLTVVDDRGCPDSICRTVEINDVLETYVPNCFTPDADGVNDSWGMVSNIPDIRDFELRVFDRWGAVIFQSEDPLGRWDGTMGNGGGGTVKQDVYVYTINFHTISTGRPEKHFGHVSLLK